MANCRPVVPKEETRRRRERRRRGRTRRRRKEEEEADEKGGKRAKPITYEQSPWDVLSRYAPNKFLLVLFLSFYKY